MENTATIQAEGNGGMTKSAARKADAITASPPPSILRKPTSVAGSVRAEELRDQGSSKSPKASNRSTPGSTRKTLNDFFQRVGGTKAAIPTPSTTGTARKVRQGAEEIEAEDASAEEDTDDMEIDTTDLDKVQLRPVGTKPKKVAKRTKTQKKKTAGVIDSEDEDIDEAGEGTGKKQKGSTKAKSKAVEAKKIPAPRHTHKHRAVVIVAVRVGKVSKVKEPVAVKLMVPLKFLQDYVDPKAAFLPKDLQS